MKNENDKFTDVPAFKSIDGRLGEQSIRILRLTEIIPEALDLLQEYYLAVNVVQRDELEVLQRLISDAASGVWLALSGTDAVGCVVLRRLQHLSLSSECKRLYVKPSARGRGVATSLLDAQETYAREKGLEWIYLDTCDELEVAIALYRDRGFQPCARYNDNPQATLFMRKNLS